MTRVEPNIYRDGKRYTVRFSYQGRPIKKEAPAGVTEIAGMDESGNLVSILTPTGGGLLRPVRNFQVS